jgi:multimeric flavodoxin WrbA
MTALTNPHATTRSTGIAGSSACCSARDGTNAVNASSRLSGSGLNSSAPTSYAERKVQVSRKGAVAMTVSGPRDYGDLRALFINCTLKKSPERSHTQGLIDLSAHIMNRQGVHVELLRAVDHDIAAGVWPDMTEHGWDGDEWPAIYRRVMAADILVIAGPIWLGDNSSVTKKVIERLYACSSLLNQAGQYAYYGRVGGCLITGNEDGVKHCAMNVLYSLQHLGYTIPPQADAGWIGAVGPGPSYLDPGSGGPENDFTNRNTTFMTWNMLHLARMLKDAGGIPAHGNQRSEWDAGCRFDFDNPEHR